jgi:hypothetical protein
MMSMTCTSLKKEEQITTEYQEDGDVVQINLSDDDVCASLLSLESEETHLLEQKQHLKDLLLQLEKKAKEQVDKKKRKVDRLDLEVSELKCKCEKLAKMINSEDSLV